MSDGNQLPPAGETACPTDFAKRLIQQGGAGGFACRSHGHNQWSASKLNKSSINSRKPLSTRIRVTQDSYILYTDAGAESPPEFIMTRASWSTLLVTVVLSSFAGAAEKSGKVWWPQFRGPNSSGVGEGRPPVQFGPGQKVRWKAAV